MICRELQTVVKQCLPLARDAANVRVLVRDARYETGFPMTVMRLVSAITLR